MPGKKMKVGSYRLPEGLRPEGLRPKDRKASAGDARDKLARRAKRHLQGLSSGRREVVDPDTEIRQAPRQASPASPFPSRSSFCLDDED